LNKKVDNDIVDDDDDPYLLHCYC